jgi:hypothetical protein
MTPQERELLSNLISRLRQSPPQEIDSEAESLINDLVREKPETPYILAQTVLIQDYALHQAQARIADLEQQLVGQQPHREGGFLSAIFGSNKPPSPQPHPQPTYQPPQPTYAPAAGPWGAAPVAAPMMFAQQGAQPSFLRSAATTAAGIAGGALLFQGIESLFGGHGYGGFGGGFGGLGGGFMPQPGITETVVNNYYGDAAPGAGTGPAQADFRPDNAGFDPSSDLTDAGFDDNADFGGGDLGGGDDYV